MTDLISKILDGTAPRWPYNSRFFLVNGIALAWTGWKPKPATDGIIEEFETVGGQWYGMRLADPAATDLATATGNRHLLVANAIALADGDDASRETPRAAALIEFLANCAVLSDADWPLRGQEVDEVEIIETEGVEA